MPSLRSLRPFRPIVIIVSTGTLLALVLIILWAVDQAHAGDIAKGVRVAGIPVGGLRPADARERLNGRYVARLKRPVVVRFGKHNFTLTADRSLVNVDIDATVDAAVKRSRQGGFFGRATREMFGGSIDADLRPEVTYRRMAVSDFVERVKTSIDAKPRNARVEYKPASLGNIKSVVGHTVDAAALSTAVTKALTDPNATHDVRPVVSTVRPKLTTAALARRYPAIITIDRANFRLRLWKHLKLAKTYTIAVGQAGLETPAGLYHVLDKQVNPSWHVPNSAWAGKLAGMIIPPGPADPIKSRWMGIFNGAGIHGTDNIGSLGTAASHGCIRMAIPDVEALYDQVPLAAPVFIA